MAQSKNSELRGVTTPIAVEVPVEENFEPIRFQPYTVDETATKPRARSSRTTRQTSAAPTTQTAASGKED